MTIKVIINPLSTVNCNIVSDTLKMKFKSSTLDIEYTRFPRHAEQIAKRSVKYNYDLLIVVGGDGTINEVINGILNQPRNPKLKLGIIPGGSANDLASMCQISNSLNDACDVISSGGMRHIDVISVNGRFFATAGGIGLPQAIATTANDMKRTPIGNFVKKFLKSGIYIFSAIYHILKYRKENRLITIRWDNHVMELNPLAVLIHNQPFLGGNFNLIPGSVNDDGLIDIGVIKNVEGRIHLVSLFARIVFKNNLSDIKTWRTRELWITSEKPISIFGDGENLRFDNHYYIKLLPKALSIIVPSQGEHYAKAA